MEELRNTFLSMVTSGSDDPQGRGYGLEDLLAELFDLHEIPYRRSYRTPTEQIDGSFQWKGFDYLVEARWRVIPPTETELGGFKSKVDKKLSSTRVYFCQQWVSAKRSFSSSLVESLRTLCWSMVRT